MKKFELFFAFILVPVDYAMLLLAGLSAYYLRFASLATDIRPVIFSLSLNKYFNILLLVAAIWLLWFVFVGLYNLKDIRRVKTELRRVISACSLGLVSVVILIFISRELFSSRFIVLVAWVLSIVYVITARLLIRWAQHWLYRFGVGVKQVVIIGNSQTTTVLINYFSSRQGIGYKVVKRLDDFSLASANDLADFVKLRTVDEILQTDPNLSKTDNLRLYNFTDEHHLVFKYVADLLDTNVLRIEVSDIAGVPIIEAKKTPLDGWGRISKRIFDLITSLILIILTSPIMLIVAILIKIDSRGPIFYKNERVSRRGTFKLFKFRSMQIQFCTGVDYDNNKEAIDYERELIVKQNTKQGPVYKIKNDPRITRLGRFIRRWSIDELPQFFNVLIGNMSLVGPRPHQAREVEKYKTYHKKVLSIKPGITGLAQVSGRSDLSFEDEVKLDTYYIENWSLLTDLAILFKTPLAVLKTRQAE